MWKSKECTPYFARFERLEQEKQAEVPSTKVLQTTSRKPKAQEQHRLISQQISSFIFNLFTSKSLQTYDFLVFLVAQIPNNYCLTWCIIFSASDYMFSWGTETRESVNMTWTEARMYCRYSCKSRSWGKLRILKNYFSIQNFKFFFCFLGKWVAQWYQWMIQN